MSSSALELVEHIIEQGGDADDILRSVVSALVVEPGVSWAGVAFLEDGELRLGPATGAADETRRLNAPVLYQGAPVAQVMIDGEMEEEHLDRIAALVAPYALIGWDTGGEAWEP